MGLVNQVAQAVDDSVTQEVMITLATTSLLAHTLLLTIFLVQEAYLYMIFIILLANFY